MNRYVVRALVAVLTFCIGMAVGRGPHRPRHRWGRVYYGSSFRFENPTLIRPHSRNAFGPFVTVDSTETDPLRISYSSTRNSVEYVGRQRVEFSIDRRSSQAIESFSVVFKSAPGRSTWEVTKRILSPELHFLGASQPVWIDCDPSETFTAWVSSVQFKDGTHWENPRHPVEQTDL
jgi:hypothetical protein